MLSRRCCNSLLSLNSSRRFVRQNYLSQSSQPSSSSSAQQTRAFSLFAKNALNLPSSSLLKPVRVWQSVRFASTALDPRVKPGNVRNVAIIAHVDHGKTTLVDCLLRQGNIRIESGTQRVMDHNPLERERGITILAKCTSIVWQDPSSQEFYQLNIVDTPGHADFGGEVERIMGMVDGVCLVVDASDGPMTQTKFVLSKALARGLSPVLVLNKCDRPTQRAEEVQNEIFDLCMSLGASDQQLDFPTIYCSARDGWATTSFSQVKPMSEAAQQGSKPESGMTDLFRTMIGHFTSPKVDYAGPFSMLVTQIDVNPFFGRLLLGRVQSGKITVGETIQALSPNGKVQESMKIQKIVTRRGLEQVFVDEAIAGDMVGFSGWLNATVNSTLCHTSVKETLPSIPIDPPTLCMRFSVNSSPFNGKDGTQINSQALRQRLYKEAESNVALRICEAPGASGEAFEVSGRGELQLGVLIETMRREGFELSISPPQVVLKRPEDIDQETGLPKPEEELSGSSSSAPLDASHMWEPIEEVSIDCDAEHQGFIIEQLSGRKGEMTDLIQLNAGSNEPTSRVRLIFHIPTRGLLGFRAILNNLTQGAAVLNNVFYKYQPHKGEFDSRRPGAIIATAEGEATGYALQDLEDRGTFFVSAGEKVYAGMVIGECNKEQDIEVNIAKQKATTNVRTTQRQDTVKISPKRDMSLEELISYMRDDEMVEVTPKNIRLRKAVLDANERSRINRAKKAAKK